MGVDPDAPEPGTERLSLTVEDGVVLSMTFHLPRRHGVAPAPLTITIPAGPGRYQYDLLVDRLLDGGMAVLEFDKRGSWASTGETTEDIQVHVRDLAAIVRLMRRRGDVDPGRIALLGVCQGGVIGAALAHVDRSIGALVLLSVPVGAGPALFIHELGFALADAGLAEGVAAEVISAIAALLTARSAGATHEATADLRARAVDAFIAAGKDPDSAIDTVAWAESPDVVASWTTGVDEMLAGVEMPVLAVYADIDPYVSASVNMPAARRVLAANRDATVTMLTGVNHVFQHAVTGTFEEMKELGALHSAPELLELIGPWLRSRLGR